MKIKRILEAQQLDMRKQKQQNSKKKSKRGKKENLSFSDCLNLMKHSSYKRHKGAIKQVR